MIVETCGYPSVRLLIEAYHYLHRMPSGIKQCYILLRDDRVSPIGAAVFSNGRIQYDGKYLDFSRLWVDDECPTNTESYFVGECLRRLSKAFPSYEGVVTWADPKAGHNGTLYKACNFIFDGLSTKTRRFYDPVTRHIIYQRSNKGQVGLQELEPDQPKRRFIYYFDPRMRESMRDEQNLQREKERLSL